MFIRRNFGKALAACAFVCAACACRAQSTPASPAPCTASPQPVPCSATPAQSNKPAAESFPFPGEDVPSAPNAVTSSSPTAPKANSDASDASKKQVDRDFPFPGEAPAASSTSSSSSSSSDDPTPDPDAAGLKDKGSEGSQAPQGRHILHRVNPIGTKLLTPEEREAEDLDVAHFYTQTGDLQGAYLRTQDAVKTAPSDPDAHCALAGVAVKLKKADEAIAEYNACLKLDPDDKQAKNARKELARLKP